MAATAPGTTSSHSRDGESSPCMPVCPSLFSQGGKTFPGLPHFPLHLLSQNCVTRPPPAAQEARQQGTSSKVSNIILFSSSSWETFVSRQTTLLFHGCCLPPPRWSFSARSLYLLKSPHVPPVGPFTLKRNTLSYLLFITPWDGWYFPFFTVKNQRLRNLPKICKWEAQKGRICLHCRVEALHRYSSLVVCIV